MLLKRYSLISSFFFFFKINISCFISWDSNSFKFDDRILMVAMCCKILFQFVDMIK